MRTIAEQVKTAPTLADLAIEAVKPSLLNLSWLDQALGRAWPIPRKEGTKKITEPCIYCEGNRYETLVPSSDLGNYSFFVLMDSGRIENDYMHQPFALIVWYDMRNCFDNGANRRDSENLKKDIIDILNDFTYRSGVVELNRIYEMPKQVYKEFTFDVEQNQSLVQPFGAIRFEGEFIIRLGCYE